jgi:hypothetical protein
MENQSSLKEHLCQLEKRLLEPEIRTAPAELKSYSRTISLNLGVRGIFGIKRIVLVRVDLVCGK